jgi:chromosome segregation ATPase
MWRRSGKGELPSEQQVLSEIEQEQQEIAKIQRQRDGILKLQESFLKKDQELARLTALVEKYQPYFERCSAVRVELAEREGAVRALTR